MNWATASGTRKGVLYVIVIAVEKYVVTLIKEYTKSISSSIRLSGL